MNVSDQTRVELINGQYGPYAKMTRMSQKGDRWLNLNQNVMDKIHEALSNITDAVKNREEKTFNLNEKAQIEVKSFQDKHYVCFMTTTEKQTGKIFYNRMNLTAVEWDGFVKVAKKFKKSPMMKRAAPDATHVNASKKTRKHKHGETDDGDGGCFNYRWSDSANSSHIFFFTEEDCEAHHAQYGVSGDEPIISSIAAPFPDPDFWQRKIVIFLTNDLILKKATDECEACRIDDPSQFQHLTGCLNEWETQVDRYFHESIDEILPETIAKVFNQLMRHCKRNVKPMQPSNLGTHGIKQSITGQDLKVAEFGDEYHHQYQLVKLECNL